MSRGKDYTPPIMCIMCGSNNVKVYKDNYYDGYCYDCKEKTTLTVDEDGKTIIGTLESEVSNDKDK